MPPTLEHRLTDLRRRVRQTLAAYGLSWLAATFIGSVLAACLADWLFHFDDAGVRLILALAVLAGGGWVAYRRLVIPLRVPLTDVDLALRIEDRYPGFQDSLASSVQFLESESSPRIGSPALQQEVIRQTLSRLDGLEGDDVLQTREVRRIVAIALAVCLIAAVVAGLDRTQTSIALRRLFLPFAAPAWPRQTNLRLLNADLEPMDAGSLRAIARGDVLKLYAENQTGRLPGNVRLEYKTDDGKVLTEPMRPMSVNASEGGSREVALGQLTVTKGDVEFRAVGGDDEGMSWHKLRVIPPPVIERLNVTLTPPPYAKKPSERRPDGVGHIQGLVGTRVEISAAAGKPLQSAAIRVRDQQRFPAQVGNDALSVAASFLITEPGTYSWWFDLKDDEGFENAEPARYELRAIPDAEPEIRIELPASDLQVTPDAEIVVRTAAKDDLGLREIRLVYRRDETEAAQAAVIPLFAGDSRPLEQFAEYIWSLSGLDLQSGERVLLHTEATDDFDLTDVFPDGQAPPPHVGRSVSRTLTVVSKEEKFHELAQRQAGLLDDLERAFKEEQQARDQVVELQTQWEQAGRLRPEDLDALQRTEITQRAVAGRLMNPATGLERRARDLLDELRNNRLDDPQTERRLGEMAGELGRLGEENLPAIERDLTQVRKLTQSSGSQSKGAKRRDTKSAGATKGSAAAEDQSTATQPEETRAELDKDARAAEQSPSPADSKKADSTSKAGKSGNSSAERPSSAKPPLGKAGDDAENSLKQAAENQQAVLESLSDMLQELSQWRNEQDAARELGELIGRQTDLNQKTAELGKQTLTKPRESLAPQEQADLKKLADRQRKQAEQLGELESRMQEKIDALSQSDPSAAATLKDALEQSRDQGVRAQMSEAGGQIGENRMGEATRAQSEVLEKLQELANTLNEDRDSDTETLVKKLKESEKELEDLRDREEVLLRKVQEAEKIDDPAERQAELERLRKEQQQVREETAKLARRLQRLQARRPSGSALRAASRMQQAQESLDEGAESEAAAQQQEALDDLEQAQRELARERRRAEEQLAREQLDKIASELAAMIGRQQGVIDETRRLEALRQSTGRLVRAQLVALRDATDVQRNLKEDTDRLAEKLTAAEVFAQALRGAARHMARAVELLEVRETGTEAQQAQASALRRFIDLTEALKQDEPEPGAQPPAQEQQGGGAGEDQGQPPGDGIPAIAQIKMLLALQRELLERTTRLGELRESGQALTPAQQAELEALAVEQSELADLARNLSRLASEPQDEAEGSGPEQPGPDGNGPKNGGESENDGEVQP